MNIGKVVRDAVGDVAPHVIGALTGGPAAKARAVRDIAHVVLGNRDASEDQVQDALDAMPPDQRVKALMALEAEYTAQMTIEAEDRADARDFADDDDDKTARNLAYADLALLLVMIGVTYLFVVAGTPSEFFQALLAGVIGHQLKAVAQSRDFYFGSSRGSKRKGKKLEALAR